MSEKESTRMTQLLERARAGEAEAAERLAELILPELKQIASRLLRTEHPGRTLQTGDLVNEIYIRLDPRQRSYKDRIHFKAYAARLMRWELIDRARQKRRRGRRVDLEEARIVSGDRSEEFLRLEDALHGLEQIDAPLARIVELKFFGGLTIDEIAEATGRSPDQIKRDWRTARAFLQKELLDLGLTSKES